MSQKETISVQIKDASYTDKLQLKIKAYFLHLILKLENFWTYIKEKYSFTIVINLHESGIFNKDNNNQKKSISKWMNLIK